MKSYYIRYMPVSSPSRIDPDNWGMVTVRVDDANSEQEALAAIPEFYQRSIYEIWEAAE